MGPVGTTREALIAKLYIFALPYGVPMPLRVCDNVIIPVEIPLSLYSPSLTLPMILRISSRPQAPASRSLPSIQARKRARLFENSIGLNGFSAGPRPFRNWARSGDGSAGAWGRDEIRNITGSINIMRLAVGGAVGPFSLINDRIVAVGVGGVTASISDIGFSASNVVSTGPQNVPPHIWQPIIIYLGRPR